jgi:pilus assembly protein Flp/PilA
MSIKAWRTRLRSLGRDSRGATAIEYGLIVAVLATALLVGYAAATGSLNTLFSNLTTEIGDA